MDRVPILKIGDILLVSIQVDLQDQTARRSSRRTWPSGSWRTGAHGVIIDITALDIVDSFVGRMLSTIAADVPGARRRDRRGRHAPGGGDHPGRAGPVAERRAHRAERGAGHGDARGGPTAGDVDQPGRDRRDSGDACR